VRRLLLRQRLYGTKIGFVWAIFPDDLEAFTRLRRRPGRPRKAAQSSTDGASKVRMAGERKRARTAGLLRKRRRKPARR
jgi:hypothetical protein